MKYEASAPRAEGLKAEYESQWDLASSSSRDKASLFIAPGGYRF